MSLFVSPFFPDIGSTRRNGMQLKRILLFECLGSKILDLSRIIVELEGLDSLSPAQHCLIHLVLSITKLRVSDVKNEKLER